MPLYEYRCSNCSVIFTELRSLTEKDAKIDCPKCGCFETKLFISSFSVHAGGSVVNSSCSSSSNQFT